MHIQKLLGITKGITLIEMAPSLYIFISICPVDMNKYARFDEIPSMTLKDIKNQNVTNGLMDGQHENSITIHKHSLWGEGGWGGGGGGEGYKRRNEN